MSKLARAASAGHFQVQEVTGGVPALSLMQLSEVITVGRNRKALPDSQFSIELGARGQCAALSTVPIAAGVVHANSRESSGPI